MGNARYLGACPRYPSLVAIIRYLVYNVPLDYRPVAVEAGTPQMMEDTTATVVVFPYALSV